MLSYFLLFTAEDPSVIAAKFAEYMRDARSLQVEVRISMTGVPSEGVGSLTLEPKVRSRFQMKWGPQDYLWATHEKSVMEIEHGAKVYREYPPIGRIVMPDSKISWIPRYAYPTIFLIGDLRSLAPGESDWSNVRTAVEGMNRLNTISTTFVGELGQIKLFATVDQEGRLTELRNITPSPRGPVETVFKLANYRKNQAIPETEFLPEAPLGYTPDSLEGNYWPPQPGAKLDLSGLVDVENGRSLADVVRGKATLVVVSQMGCSPSGPALEHLQTLLPALRKAQVEVVLVSAASGAPHLQRSWARTFRSESGSGMERLQAPGTPFFILVDAKGVMRQGWLGFEPSEAAKRHDEILAEVKALNETPSKG